MPGRLHRVAAQQGAAAKALLQIQGEDAAGEVVRRGLGVREADGKRPLDGLRRLGGREAGTAQPGLTTANATADRAERKVQSGVGT